MGDDMVEIGCETRSDLDEYEMKSRVYSVEYQAIIAKMNSNESWAYSFVALYFAFLASLSFAVGFLRFPVDGRGVFDLSVNLLGVSLSLSEFLAVFAIILYFWAISMIFDYKIQTRSLIGRLCFLESELGLSQLGPSTVGVGLSRQHNNFWRFGQFVLVGSVMVMLFGPWFVLLMTGRQ